MDKNRILFKLSEFDLIGIYGLNDTNSEKYRDIFPENDIANWCITSVFEQSGENSLTEEKRAEILHNINPNYPLDIDSYKVDKEEIFFSIIENIRYFFQNIIPVEKEDEEMCSALCIGLWWWFNSPEHDFCYDEDDD